MSNYFIMHGSYGNPIKNWIPWLKKELSKRKLKCIIPHFPSPIGQNYETWEKLLNYYKEIGYINEDTIFITHSISSVCVVKYLINNKIKVKGIISIAGFNNCSFNDENDIYDSFYMNDNEMQLLGDYCTKKFCIYSNDDPYVPLSKAEEFADNILAEKMLIKSGGHFNERSGYIKFEKLLELI